LSPVVDLALPNEESRVYPGYHPRNEGKYLGVFPEPPMLKILELLTNPIYPRYHPQNEGKFPGIFIPYYIVKRNRQRESR
jgi:hypothetical protein